MGKKLDFIKMLIFAGILPILFFSVVHEHRHKAIAEGMGCDPEINYLPDLEDNTFMSVSYNCPESMTDEKRRMMTLMQSNVETTGYQLIPILAVSILSLILVYPQKKYGGDNNSWEVRNNQK